MAYNFIIKHKTRWDMAAVLNLHESLVGRHQLNLSWIGPAKVSQRTVQRECSALPS